MRPLVAEGLVGETQGLAGATTEVCEPAKNRGPVAVRLERVLWETGDWEMGATEVGGVR